MSRTRIVIIQLKEIIYTAIFAGLGILLIVLLLIMFRPGSKDSDAAAADAKTSTSISAETAGSEKTASYQPGVYTSQFTLGENTLNMEVTVEENQVISARLVNLEESVTTMYPLVEPALNEITDQLKEGTPLENVVLSSENQYTQNMLLEVLDRTLEKAEK